MIGLFDLFRIGIGPSSSHTVGPMRAAGLFVAALRQGGDLERVRRLRVDLYGSLALTGKGHRTDVGVMLGLMGEEPETVASAAVDPAVAAVERDGVLSLGASCGASCDIPFSRDDDIVFHKRDRLPLHPNGLRFTAADADGACLRRCVYYSTGGGFVADESGRDIDQPSGAVVCPHPFASAAEMLAMGDAAGLSIAEMAHANEIALYRGRRPKRAKASDARIDALIRRDAMAVWSAMEESIDAGIAREGELPGGLRVRRRAADLHRRLRQRDGLGTGDEAGMGIMDWVNLYALAVNEENAAGGRIVTAPTNGAAGVIPATIAYYLRHHRGQSRTRVEDDVMTMLFTAAAIGGLYKRNASISAAEMGCQGEIGVACSMAAAALTAACGGGNRQIENAAEIGMEHNLGLTCDPVGGLVQIPCIERNTMGAIKAINASRLALIGDGVHLVSLDQVIETMRQTGRDMQDKYKETSTGGLAVNWVAC